MKINVPQTVSFIYSLMLHTVFITTLLLLSPPLYRISGDFPFVDVRLYSSFLFRDNNKPINKALQKSAASNKTKTRQDVSSKSVLEKKESPENKKAPEKVEDSDIAQQLEQFAKEQRESEEPTASVLKDAIKEDRKNELSQDIDSAGLKGSAEELKQKEEPPAEPKVDVKEESEPKSEETIKTARIKENDAPMIEKAIDSLFDNEGVDNKEVKPFKEKTDEVHSQPSLSLQNKKAEIKINIKEKEIVATHLPSLAAPSQSTAQEIKSSSIDKISELQDKETLADLPETKGAILFEPYGDLKFEIKIEEGLINNLKTTITYREFLKKQRNRPLKKSEVKYIRVEPKIINRGDNIIIVIVETAGEGIYKFMIESDNKPFKASLAVKLYEKSAKEKSKTLGTMTVNDKTIAAKILMPEGILWDDDSYFSGYMEDSESITKFNTDSGLIWKEYKE
jgi:hypothetical protein